MSAPLAQARRYLDLGWSVIPLRRDKRPYLPWQTYQTRRPDPDELSSWWQRWPEANVGVVTGTVSGILVLDTDGPDGEAALAGRHLPPTPTARTGKGIHRYYRHPGRHVPNAVRLLNGVDLRADGGYVVAPPSVHPSGKHYEWVPGMSPWDLPCAEPPTWLLHQARRTLPPPGHPPDWWRRFLADGAPEGCRNDRLARLAGYLLRHGLTPEVVLELCRAWNLARCRPPLEDQEVVSIVRSIASREWRRRQAHGPA